MTIVQGVLTSPKSGAVVRGKPFHVKVVTGASGLAFTTGGQVVGDSTVTSGADGSWSVDLPPTSGINPAGTHYALLAFGKSWAFVVPDSGPAQFEDCLVDNPDAPGAVSVGLLPSNNLSDVANAATALAHIGGISVTAAHSYTDSGVTAAEAFATAADTALRNTILGGVGPAFDTLLELANAEGSDAAAITALLASVAANTTAIATETSTRAAADTAAAAVTALARASQATYLKDFWVALANRATAPCDIVFGPGTSLTAGTGATGDQYRWQRRLIDMLRVRYPTPGVIGSSAGYLCGNGQYGGPTVVGGAAVNYGLGNRATQLSGTGQTLTWGGVPTTSTKVYLYATSVTDSVTLTLANGAPTTITPGVVGDYVYDTGPLTRASYLTVIAWAAGTPIVKGIRPFDGDETIGVRGWDNSKGGSKTGDWLTAGGGSERWIGEVGVSVTPDLVIIEQLANDYTNISAAQYATNLTSIITKVRAAAADVPILVLSMWRRTTSGVEAWDNYVAQARTIAAANACAFLDIDQLISISGTNHGFLFDTYHPGNNGYEVVAGLIYEFLTPPGSGTGDNRTLMQKGGMSVIGVTAAEATVQVRPAPLQTADILNVLDVTGATKLLTIDSAGKLLTNLLYARSDSAGSAAAGITIDSQAGFLRSLAFSTLVAGTSSPRWILRATATAEAGANSGSDLQLVSRDDSGNSLQIVLAFTRSSGTISIGDACNIGVGTTTGTKIGTSAAMKLGFWGNTPTVQPAGWGTPSGTLARTTFASDSATLAQVAQRLAALITDLKTLGLIGA